MYPSQITTTSNAQHLSYGSSAYGWSGQSSYLNTNTAETGATSWRSNTQNENYAYQRDSTYGDQDADSADNYSQNYYGRNNVSQAPSQNHTQGLSNLAYASGLEAANSRSHSAQIAQQYSSTPNSSSLSQNRARSPADVPSRYATNTLPVSTSHPMQAQTSPSSVSSQQLAVNAAAALAGAVSRRYSSANASTTSTIGQDARSSVSSMSRRTASPQVNATNIAQTFPGSQQQVSQDQPAAQSRNASRQTQLPTGPNQPPHHGSYSTVPEIGPQRQSWVTPQRAQPTGSIASLVSAPQEPAPTSYHQSTETSEPVSSFIDPARVFNPYHREHERKRQQAQAGVEAKRRAEEEEARKEEIRKQKEEEAAAEEARRKQEVAGQEAKQRQMAAQTAKKASKGAGKAKAKGKPSEPTPPTDSISNSGMDDEAAMALEMKAIMEKMKTFRNRDPSLFQKLWEDMRKPGSNGTGNSIQSPSPQLAQRLLPASQALAIPDSATQQTPAGKVPHKETRATAPVLVNPGTPDTNAKPANGWRVVVEDNFERLPDLGRFPAERRIRTSGYNKRSKIATADKPEAIVGTGTNLASATTPNTSAVAVPSVVLPPSAAKSTTDSANTGEASKQHLVTVWPVEKRNALTTAALKVLKMNPENASIELSEAELHKMLENNPSYITLCELLEQKGLRFHRSFFARELLNSVPELKTPASNNATTASASKPVQPPLPQSQPLPTPSPLAAPPAVQAVYPSPAYSSGIPPGYPQGPVQPQQQHSPYTSLPGQPPSHYGRPQHLQQPQPITFASNHPAAMNATPPTPVYRPLKAQYGPLARPQPIPGSKEAAARKRDFSELIDLTELGENDDYVMPSKHARMDDVDSDVEKETNLLQAYQTQPQKGPSHQFGMLVSQYRPPPLAPAYNSHTNNLRSNKPELATDASSQRTVLAKPLNKNEALKKVYYDPKTVARDILIATGRHPEERPLNVHLAGMLGKYIELESDVSTFEWDEIDPGGPPAPKVEYVNIPASKPRYKIGERVPNRRYKPRTPKSLIDKTRHPDPERRQLTSTSGPAAQDKPTHNHSQLQIAKKQPSKLRHSLLASEQEGLATPSLHDPTLLSNEKSYRSTSHANEIRPPDEKPITSSPAMATPLVRKRGRPPGSKNLTTVAGLKEQAIKVNVPPRESTPTKDKFRCKWRKCSTSLHNLDTLRKHIGKVHRPTSEQITKEGYTCWWKKCKFLAQDSEGAWITTQAFDHWEEWLKHIENDHITPIGMKWGNGPATQHVGKQS